jgi:hypothetical protein
VRQDLTFDAGRRADGETAENVFGFEFVKGIRVLRSRDFAQANKSTQPDKHRCRGQYSVTQPALIASRSCVFVDAH